MMRIDELVEQIASLHRSDLEAWIGEELVSPQQDAGALLFSDMECARVRLVCRSEARPVAEGVQGTVSLIF